MRERILGYNQGDVIMIDDPLIKFESEAHCRPAERLINTVGQSFIHKGIEYVVLHLGKLIECNEVPRAVDHKDTTDAVFDCEHLESLIRAGKVKLLDKSPSRQ